MPAGIDPHHFSILRALKGFSDHVDTLTIHKAAFGRLTTPSIEGVGRRLTTLSKRDWVACIKQDGKWKWLITDTGRAAVQ